MTDILYKVYRFYVDGFDGRACALDGHTHQARCHIPCAQALLLS